MGLDAIRTWKPDVVFLDLTMPYLDGFEVLRLLREQPENASLPVIVNTAKALSSYERDYLEKNAIAIVSKDRLDEEKARSEIRESLRLAGFDYKVVE
jgi:CheY-like chemotaxis protein